MTDETCRHEWAVVNLRNGYLITEGCPHCGTRVSFFALEFRHHVDTYTDGKHRWRFLGSSQSVKFDLKCSKCGKFVNLENVMGLMFCTECREDCEAAKKKVKGENTWVYLALCSDSSHVNGECVGDEEITALTEYFNGNIKTPGKKIIFVPCSERKSIDFCEGEVIADVGMKEIY